MNELSALDLRGFVTRAMQEVFDLMLSMELEPIDRNPPPEITGRRIVGTVSFAGDIMGNVSIQVSDQFARVMTGAMLGMELDELDGSEDVHDVIGELSNMIGGDLKSRLCDAGFPCALSIPSITSGSDFKIEAMNWARCEAAAFRYNENVALVDVFIKSAGQ